jgi:hypothetical protein
MDANTETAFAKFSTSFVKVSFIDSLITSLAVSVFKVVDFLDPVLDVLDLVPTHDIFVGEFGDFCLALGARVLLVRHPLLDTLIAVDVLAAI